jgi:hypothetical protein
MSGKHSSSSYFTPPADHIFGRTPSNRFWFCAFSLGGHIPLFVTQRVVVQGKTDAIPVSTGCCLAVLVGCMSRSTSTLYLASENPSAVASEWMNYDEWGGNVTDELFINVPDYYLVGMSGPFLSLLAA